MFHLGHYFQHPIPCVIVYHNIPSRPVCQLLWCIRKVPLLRESPILAVPRWTLYWGVPVLLRRHLHHSTVGMYPPVSFLYEVYYTMFMLFSPSHRFVSGYQNKYMDVVCDFECTTIWEI